MLVEVSRTAEADLLAICAALGPSMAGEQLVDDFTRQLANLRLFPRMGSRNYPLAKGGLAVLLGDGKYLMTYEVIEDRVVVSESCMARGTPVPYKVRPGDPSSAHAGG